MSKDGFAALSQCIKRQNALFDVGRWVFDVQIFLHAIPLAPFALRMEGNGDFYLH